MKSDACGGMNRHSRVYEMMWLMALDHGCNRSHHLCRRLAKDPWLVPEKAHNHDCRQPLSSLMVQHNRRSWMEQMKSHDCHAMGRTHRPSMGWPKVRDRHSCECMTLRA